MMEDQPETSPLPAQEEPQQPTRPEIPAPEGKPPKPKLPMRRRIFRWSLLFLIILGIGAILALQLAYVPMRSEVARLQSELSAQAAQMQTIQTRADGLTQNQDESQGAIATLEASNQETLAQLEQVNFHNTLLKARLDVARAQAALALKNSNGARTALLGTAKTLESLAASLDENEQKVLAGLQDRLTLVLNELDTNAEAAITDLSVLDASLLEIESVYFASPAPTP